MPFSWEWLVIFGKSIRYEKTMRLAGPATGFKFLCLRDGGGLKTEASPSRAGQKGDWKPIGQTLCAGAAEKKALTVY
jgi:hypothetical protein